MPYGIIYLITNRITGLRYVGQTVKTLDQRWKVHIETSGRGAGYLLHDDIRERGAAVFDCEVLAVASDKAELNRLERKYIRELNTQHPHGYNLKVGACGGSQKGDKRSEQARLNMTLAQIRRGSHPPEVIAKLKAYQSTRPPASAETRERRSASLRKYYETHSPPPVSAETRELLSAAGKRRGPLSEAGRQALSEKQKRQNATDWMREVARRHARTRTDQVRDPKTGRMMRKPVDGEVQVDPRSPRADESS